MPIFYIIFLKFLMERMCFYFILFIIWGIIIVIVLARKHVVKIPHTTHFILIIYVYNL